MRDCGDEAGSEVVNGGNSGLFGGRRVDILDEGCLKSMKELEWRRKMGTGHSLETKRARSLSIEGRWSRWAIYSAIIR